MLVYDSRDLAARPPRVYLEALGSYVQMSSYLRIEYFRKHPFFGFNLNQLIKLNRLCELIDFSSATDSAANIAAPVAVHLTQEWKSRLDGYLNPAIPKRDRQHIYDCGTVLAIILKLTSENFSQDVAAYLGILMSRLLERIKAYDRSIDNLPATLEKLIVSRVEIDPDVSTKHLALEFITKQSFDAIQKECFGSSKIILDGTDGTSAVMIYNGKKHSISSKRLENLISSTKSWYMRQESFVPADANSR